MGRYYRTTVPRHLDYAFKYPVSALANTIQYKDNIAMNNIVQSEESLANMLSSLNYTADDLLVEDSGVIQNVVNEINSEIDNTSSEILNEPDNIIRTKQKIAAMKAKVSNLISPGGRLYEATQRKKQFDDWTKQNKSKAGFEYTQQLVRKNITDSASDYDFGNLSLPQTVPDYEFSKVLNAAKKVSDKSNMRSILDITTEEMNNAGAYQQYYSKFKLENPDLDDEGIKKRAEKQVQRDINKIAKAVYKVDKSGKNNTPNDFNTQEYKTDTDYFTAKNVVAENVATVLGGEQDKVNEVLKNIEKPENLNSVSKIFGFDNAPFVKDKDGYYTKNPNYIDESFDKLNLLSPSYENMFSYNGLVYKTGLEQDGSLVELNTKNDIKSLIPVDKRTEISSIKTNIKSALSDPESWKNDKLKFIGKGLEEYSDKSLSDLLESGDITYEYDDSKIVKAKTNILYTVAKENGNIVYDDYVTTNEKAEELSKKYGLDIKKGTYVTINESRGGAKKIIDIPIDKKIKGFKELDYNKDNPTITIEGGKKYIVTSVSLNGKSGKMLIPFGDNNGIVNIAGLSKDKIAELKAYDIISSYLSLGMKNSVPINKGYRIYYDDDNGVVISEDSDKKVYSAVDFLKNYFK